jgi:hypothetical protein
VTTAFYAQVSLAVEKRLAGTVSVDLETRLREQRYNGHFFDRSEADPSRRYCDDKGTLRSGYYVVTCSFAPFGRGCSFFFLSYPGTFGCQGTFSASTCAYNDHSINPYHNRESLILFQNWNLDHCVEKTRTVLPGLIDALRVCAKAAALRVNVEYFFELLFCQRNLKLVHTVCHVKTGHKAKTLDRKLVFVKVLKRKRSGSSS